MLLVFTHHIYGFFFFWFWNLKIFEFIQYKLTKLYIRKEQEYLQNFGIGYYFSSIFSKEKSNFKPNKIIKT